MSVGIQQIDDLTADSEHPDLVDDFTEFFQKYHREELLQFAKGYPKDSKSFYIDWMDLYSYDMDLADDILTQWDIILPHALKALYEFPLPIDIDLEGARIRVTNIQNHDSESVASVRADMVGELVALQGRVKKVSQVKMYPREAVFICQRCGHQDSIPQGSNEFQEPYQCESCERQGPFKFDKRRSDWEDAQLMRIAQPVEETTGGQGATMDVILRGDVAEGVPGEREGEGYKAGELATVTGVVDVKEPESGSGQLPTGDPMLTGQTVTKEDDDFDSITITKVDKEEIQRILDGEYHEDYEKPIPLLKDTVAPNHHGDETIKLALLLQLIGGNEIQRADGSFKRGDFHVLLLGDPGKGKSRLLERIESIAPRSAYASGKGARAAGLTAAAVPSDFGDEKWDLEAGALVMASGGVACIDEIDKMNDDARSSMHDALATQKVHINKAGINADLPTKAACLAAGNPKYGRFDPYEPMADQIDLEPALLSRFDLMFLLSDQPEEDEDRELGEAMIEGHREEVASRHSAEEEDPGPIPDDLFTKYIAHARQSVEPEIKDDRVAEKIVDFWVTLRSEGYDEDSPVPVTPRKLMAVVRLSEASAKARHSDEVELQDVDRVAEVIMQVMNDVGIDPESGEYDADIIHTGTSKTQRDRIRTLEGLIEELEPQYENGVPVEELYAEAEEAGIDQDKAEHELSKLKAKGKAYQPHNDTVRLS